MVPFDGPRKGVCLAHDPPTRTVANSMLWSKLVALASSQTCAHSLVFMWDARKVLNLAVRPLLECPKSNGEKQRRRTLQINVYWYRQHFLHHMRLGRIHSSRLEIGSFTLM